MYPKLYSKSNQLLAVLDNIIKETATTKRVVNGEFTFSFSAFEKELKSEYFEGDNYIVVSNQAFDIKYVDKNHQDDVKYDIQCEHVNYRMEDGEENLLPSYIHMGTPREILTDILLPTEFHVGVVDFTDVITISVDTEITRKSLIYQLAKALGGEVDYTDNGFGISILRTIGKNNGFEARFGKNLKGITKTIDRRGGLKTYYVVDIIELKKSNAYIEKKLQSLEIIDVGDTIRLKDSVIGLDVENRILSVERNPILEINTKLEIANTIELITDTLQRIETESVKQGKSYNFASISSEYGFRARRSDQLAQATLGGGILSFDVGDGTGQYTPAIYFDVTSGKFKIIGDIEMQGGSINWTSVDSPDYSYDEIIGQKPPIDADNTNSVIGTRLTHIDQYGIYTGLLEAEQVTLAYYGV
jgi:hypothetical protein